MANINLKKSNYNDAIENFEKALYFFIKNSDSENILKCYLNIGKYICRKTFIKVL